MPKTPKSHGRQLRAFTGRCRRAGPSMRVRNSSAAAFARRADEPAAARGQRFARSEAEQPEIRLPCRRNDQPPSLPSTGRRPQSPARRMSVAICITDVNRLRNAKGMHNDHSQACAPTQPWTARSRCRTAYKGPHPRSEAVDARQSRPSPRTDTYRRAAQPHSAQGRAYPRARC